MIKRGCFCVCAFLVVSLSNCLNTATSCLTPKPDYISGKKLSVYPIKLFDRIGLNLCFKECQAHGGCLSANFDRKHLTCQLLSSKKSDTKPLIDDVDFFHMELPDIPDGKKKMCGEVSCNNYSTCIITTFNKSVCIKTDCAESLPNLTNGKAIIRTNNPISATFGCNTGFTGVGSTNTINCAPGGRWTLLSYRCEPPVHGGWSSWSGWNTCSKTCGSGTKVRSRSCNNPSPIYGGNYCTGSSINTALCSTNSCPIDGGWSSWGGWSSCSKTCDTGSKSRSRSCSNPYPQYGGAGCSGSSQESTNCFKEECGNSHNDEFRVISSVHLYLYL
ncbi:thrombospondin-2-like [Saccostrea echinata]|uniref:thrombospondin-2-like n=1 Tax=Saccostrea echinata TaxID=191078 RepID=UPI002A83AB16|nr:thrombospondin-2-like [Saccostrea echinata]